MRRSMTYVLLGTAIAMSIALLGCTPQPSSVTQQPQVTPTPPPATEQTSGATAATDVPTATKPVEPHFDKAAAVIYLMDGERLTAVERTVDAPGAASSAVKALLAGPSSSEEGRGLTSSIPAGTKLRSVKIDGNTASVDLSKKFSSGGGSLSMFSRVAQVVYTLTQFPSVERVIFRIEGKRVEALGGEGIILIEPQTRADYEDLAPVSPSE